MNISNYISFEENIAIISGIVLNLSEDIKISFEKNKIFVINREILNFAETKQIPNEMKMNLDFKRLNNIHYIYYMYTVNEIILRHPKCY